MYGLGILHKLVLGRAVGWTVKLVNEKWSVYILEVDLSLNWKSCVVKIEYVLSRLSSYSSALCIFTLYLELVGYNNCVKTLRIPKHLYRNSSIIFTSSFSQVRKQYDFFLIRGDGRVPYNAGNTARFSM